MSRRSWMGERRYGYLKPVYMTKDPAPRSLVELTACNCPSVKAIARAQIQVSPERRLTKCVKTCILQPCNPGHAIS